MVTSARCAPSEQGRLTDSPAVDKTLLPRFLAECGWRGALRLTVEDLDGAPIAPCQEWNQPFLVIGRRPTADVTLDHPEVSRSHAYLQVIDGRFFCMDLFSRTGTFWKDEPRTWGWIEPGEAVRVGSFRLRPAAPPSGSSCHAVAPPALPISRSYGIAGDEDAVVELASSDAHPRPAWWINRTIMLIGRSPACKLQLSHPSCAKVHAGLVRTAAGLWLVDMRSSNGTWLNGALVRCAKLGHGDEVAIGPYRLRIHTGPAASQILLQHAVVTGRTAVDLPQPQSIDVRPGLEAPLASRFGGAELERDPLVLELLRELRRQQSESAEQSRQLIALFYRMHQEQMALLVGELERLRRLVETRTPAGELPTATAPLTESSRLPLPAPGLAWDPPTATESDGAAPAPTPPSPMPTPTPAPGLTADSTAAALDTSCDVHLLLAQRLAAHKDDAGRKKTLIDWLTGLHNNLIGV